jgi:hypothetical protein
MKHFIALVLCTSSACYAAELPQSTLFTPQRVGIAASADDAIKSAAAYGCPLIAFVNQPARPVVGAISYRADPKGDAKARTWAGSATGGVYLPAAATDAELLTAAIPYLPRRMPIGCAGGVCR